MVQIEHGRLDPSLLSITLTYAAFFARFFLCPQSYAQVFAPAVDKFPRAGRFSLWFGMAG
jgi:hypothetical protein